MYGLVLDLYGMYGHVFDFHVSILNGGNIKYPIETSIFFAESLTLELFRITFADADIGSLKFLHKYLYHMLVKFEQNRIIQTTRKF